MKKFLLFIPILFISFLLVNKTYRVSANYLVDNFGTNLTFKTLSLHDDFEVTTYWVNDDTGNYIFEFAPIEVSLEELIRALGNSIFNFMKLYHIVSGTNYNYFINFNQITYDNIAWTQEDGYIYLMIKTEWFDLEYCSTTQLSCIDELSKEINVDTWVFEPINDGGYQEGYNRGYEDGFSHDNRVKIALWEYDNINLNVLDTVYRFEFNNFIVTYGIFSPIGLTTNQIKNKVFIPTFNGYVGAFNTSVRQWYFGTVVPNLYLYVEKEIIQEIENREIVGIIQAFRIYLQENNIYGYFERADGKTKYQLGYEDGYNIGRYVGYNDGYYLGRDEGYNIGYTEGERAGYEDGMENGLTIGRQEGYYNGRRDGYNEASKEFRENFGLKVDVWLVPTIIIVFAVGIFVTYRRGRDV